jgi:microcompartment protein CcmK/EutM
VYLARVTGTVVATRKYPGLEGAKLLLVRKTSRTGELVGGPLVACDNAQAGEGDLVYCVASREAALAQPEPFVPVDAAIVGVVDAVTRAAEAEP